MQTNDFAHDFDGAREGFGADGSHNLRPQAPQGFGGRGGRPQGRRGRGGFPGFAPEQMGRGGRPGGFPGQGFEGRDVDGGPDFGPGHFDQGGFAEGHVEQGHFGGRFDEAEGVATPQGFGPQFGGDFGGDPRQRGPRPGRGERPDRGERRAQREARHGHGGGYGDDFGGGRGGFGPGFEGIEGGFGPMGPGFGPGRGRGGRGPGRGRKGDVRNTVLALLKDQPMNGYQLITAISEKTDGLWSPGAGSIYPALGLLTDEGLIRESEVDGKKVSELTDAGRDYVEQHADELSAPWEKVAGPHQGFLDVRPTVGQLAMAVQQVVMQGDQAQIEAVRGILDQAKKDIYKLLAGE